MFVHAPLRHFPSEPLSQATLACSAAIPTRLAPPVETCLVLTPPVTGFHRSMRVRRALWGGWVLALAAAWPHLLHHNPRPFLPCLFLQRQHMMYRRNPPWDLAPSHRRQVRTTTVCGWRQIPEGHLLATTLPKCRDLHLPRHSRPAPCRSVGVLCQQPPQQV